MLQLFVSEMCFSHKYVIVHVVVDGIIGSYNWLVVQCVVRTIMCSYESLFVKIVRSQKEFLEEALVRIVHCYLRRSEITAIYI